MFWGPLSMIGSPWYLHRFARNLNRCTDPVRWVGAALRIICNTNHEEVSVDAAGEPEEDGLFKLHEGLDEISDHHLTGEAATEVRHQVLSAEAFAKKVSPCLLSSKEKYGPMEPSSVIETTACTKSSITVIIVRNW